MARLADTTVLVGTNLPSDWLGLWRIHGMDTRLFAGSGLPGFPKFKNAQKHPLTPDRHCITAGAVMAGVMKKTWSLLRLIRGGRPALCNIAVTNSCNATCDFCNFANGKIARKDMHWMAASRLDAALEILHGRGIRYIGFFGGEPLLHPHIAQMIAHSINKGMGTALITNGWLLASKLDELVASGLKTIYISIDAADIETHEANRGLKRLGDRIREATARMPDLGVTPLAQVTMSKLIENYHLLAPFLRGLGFKAVAFSYPQRTRLGSSSLAWSDT